MPEISAGHPITKAFQPAPQGLTLRTTFNKGIPMTMNQAFAKECREEVRHYRERAANAKRNGWECSRATYIKCALFNRANARKWASM